MAAFARQLAIEGRWEDAIGVNQQLIERSPRDVDALNRLGKAYFELHRYRSAYESYAAALEADPANIIARRNMERIEPLRDIEEDLDSDSAKLPPARYGAFVEEAGKTYVDELINVAPSAVLRTLSAGEKLQIRREDGELYLVDEDDQVIGQPEPRLARRLMHLMDKGNEYEIFVTANAGDQVRVIVREVSRSPEMAHIMSFPQQVNAAVPRAYVRDSRLFRADENDLIIPTDDDEEIEEEETLDPDAELDELDGEDSALTDESEEKSAFDDDDDLDLGDDAD